jgi:AhpC/TSA family/Disulphide bond corrector protein DsbC
LRDAEAKFRERGIGLAAISYDGEAILKDFSDRQHISYPLLADPDSAIIRSFGVLNEEATGFSRGMAHPGYFYLGRDGSVKEEFFEAAYTDRFSANNLLGKIFPELIEGTGTEVATPYIHVSLRQSDRVAIPGSRVTLQVDISLPKDVHVYAPEVTGYKPVKLEIDPAPEFSVRDARYPKSKVLYLKAINEKVPVFEGEFRIAQDVVVTASREFMSSLGEGRSIKIQGRLLYQACNSTVCFQPKQAPLLWDLQVLPLDRKRAPEAIRHK